MVFNVLTDNKDDHAKNFSFIYKEGNWALAPAYDLTLSLIHILITIEQLKDVKERTDALRRYL